MLKKIKVGDTVAFKPAILFGLETFIREKMNANSDPDFHIGTIEWGREGFGEDEAQKTVISFIEPPKPVEIAEAPQNSPVVQYPWTIFVQGILLDNLTVPTYPAYELVAEIKMHLQELREANSGQAVSNILNLGATAQRKRGNRNNIADLHIGAETVRGPGEHSRFTFFWLPIHFDLVEDRKSPRVVAQNPL